MVSQLSSDPSQPINTKTAEYRACQDAESHTGSGCLRRSSRGLQQVEVILEDAGSSGETDETNRGKRGGGQR